MRTGYGKALLVVTVSIPLHPDREYGQRSLEPCPSKPRVPTHMTCSPLAPGVVTSPAPRRTHKKYRKRGYKDETLNQTINVCRPCHSAIHRAHDEFTLAERFTTREQLLADESIGRFVAWARKQRITTKADANNNLLRYRR